MSKVAVRIKNFRSWADVANATRHGRREDPAPHVDRERTKLNVHWELAEDGQRLVRAEQGADIRACMERLGKERGAKWRKGAAVGTEMLWIASPDFFEQHGPRGSAEWMKAAEKWARDCLAETEAGFSGQVAAARLDLDEQTPHLSVFILPMTEKEPQGPRRGSDEAKAAELLKDPSGASEAALRAAQGVWDRAEAKRARRKPRLTVSAGAHFGKRHKLVALQDWAAEAMARRGHALDRGEPKTTKGRDHQTPAAGRAKIEAAEKLAKKIIEDAQAAGTKFERAFEAFATALKELAPVELVDAVRKRYLELMKPQAETKQSPPPPTHRP